MEKTEEMIEKVLNKLDEIYDEEDFLTAIMSVLKNDYECEHLLRLIDEYNVQTPDNVLIIALLISKAGDKTQRIGDYLKDIDSDVDKAILDEDTYEYEDDEDEDDGYDEDEEEDDYDEEEDNAERAFLKRMNSLDFRQTVEDAKNGDIKAKW
nr:hypothetical protein [Saccharofermentans sp.]